MLQLVDKWGNESTIENGGQLNRIKHQKVLAVLEKRALRYRCGGRRVGLEKKSKGEDPIDDTGTVLTEGLTDDDSKDGELVWQMLIDVRQEEVFSALGVQEEVLQVHGMAPGTKGEGVTRLIYENLDGLANKISENEKLEKAKTIIDDLEADMACFNKHKQNLMHKDNAHGL